MNWNLRLELWLLVSGFLLHELDLRLELWLLVSGFLLYEKVD